MGCFSKMGLFVLNFLIFGVGVAVVALSSYIIHENNVYKEMFEDGMFSVPICILIAGLIIVIIGFLGCCGAMKENSCMLRTYAFIMIVLLVAEIVLGILILVYPEETEDFIQDSMNTTFSKYGTEPALNQTVDAMQHDLECCGVHNYTDWLSYDYSKGKDVSPGCCREITDGCNEGILKETDLDKVKEKIFTQGCYYALKEDLQGVTIALGVVVLLLAIVQTMVISCACGLAKDSRYA